MSFQKKIREKLEEYKKINFGDIPDGSWEENKNKYPHILPKENYKLNILASLRDDFWKSKYRSMKRHIYFHHLNSSQAMCINYFYPLIRDEKLDGIIKDLGIITDSLKYDSVCFEKVSGLESGCRRPTNFDFYFETKEGWKFHFEIKFTEQEFGKAGKDKYHSDKFRNTYKKLINCEESPIMGKYREEKEFLGNYQLLRNLVHLGSKSYVIFIYPEENEKIRQQAEFAKESFIEAKYKENVICKTWKEMVAAAEKILGEDTKWLEEFKEKYQIETSR
jgi:hypothetical protein